MSLQLFLWVLGVIRDLPHGGITARWSKVSERTEEQHLQKAHSATPSRAAGGSEIGPQRLGELRRLQSRARFAHGKDNRDNMQTLMPMSQSYETL